MKIAAVMIAFLLVVQTGSASVGSGFMGPDSFLYPLKIWIDKLSINLAFNQTEKAQKMIELADKRLKEAEEMRNSSNAFKKAMGAYTDQLEELQDFMKNGTENKTIDIYGNIKQKVENQTNRTKVLKIAEKISIIQQNIIQASSSAGESRIKVSVIDGNVSVQTQGGNATITEDGGNVTVISVTNNSRQKVVVKSSGNSSFSSSSVVVHSSSVVTSGN